MWQIMHLFVGMVDTWLFMWFSKFLISSHVIHSALHPCSLFSRETCNFSFVLHLHLSYVHKVVCIEWVFYGLRIRLILQVSLLIILKFIFQLFLLTIIVTLLNLIIYFICLSLFLKQCLSKRSWLTKIWCLMPLVYQMLTICFKWSFFLGKRCGSLVISASSEIRSRMTTFSEFHTFLLMQLTEFNYFSFWFVLIFFGYFFLHFWLYLLLWFLV